MREYGQSDKHTIYALYPSKQTPWTQCWLMLACRRRRWININPTVLILPAICMEIVEIHAIWYNSPTRWTDHDELVLYVFWEHVCMYVCMYYSISILTSTSFLSLSFTWDDYSRHLYFYDKRIKRPGGSGAVIKAACLESQWSPVRNPLWPWSFKVMRLLWGVHRCISFNPVAAWLEKRISGNDGHVPWSKTCQ